MQCGAFSRKLWNQKQIGCCKSQITLQLLLCTLELCFVMLLNIKTFLSFCLSGYYTWRYDFVVTRNKLIYKTFFFCNGFIASVSIYFPNLSSNNPFGEKPKTVNIFVQKGNCNKVVLLHKNRMFKVKILSNINRAYNDLIYWM